MAVIWDAKHPDYTEDELRLGRFTNYLLGKKFPGVSENIQRAFSLYRFLQTHRDWDAAQFQSSIRNNGHPLYSMEDIESIVRTMHRQRGGVQGTLGKGVPGAGPGVPGAGPGVPGAGPVVQGPVVDETRNEFFDKMFRKISYSLPSIPRCFDGFMWYIYILYNLEQLDFVGPIIASILDTITLSLPVIANLCVDVSGKLIGLLPVPYVGLGGEAIGYLISLIFVSIAVTLNISRKHFGTAFKSSLGGIPLIGDALFSAARSFEIGMKRFEISKGRMLKSVKKISPTTQEFLEYYTPDSNIHPGPAPSFNTNTIKAEVATFVKKETGLDKVENKLGEVSASMNQTLGSLPTLPNAAVLSKPNAPKNVTQVTNAPKNVTQVTNVPKNVTQVTNVPKNVTQTANSSQKPNKNGAANRNVTRRRAPAQFAPVPIQA